MKTKLSFDSEVYHLLSLQLGVLDTFNGSWKVKAVQQSSDLKELLMISTMESTASMTGNELAGYREAQELILDNFADMEISEQTIHHLHKILFKHCEKDQLHRGNYRISSSKVVARYSDSTQPALYNPTPPKLIRVEMPNLIDWLNERISKQDMHPLVYIAGFVYEFLSILPYKDGNGRLSRLLTILLMMKQGYEFIPYESFEKLIESSREAYYRVLWDGQQNRHKDQEQISAWVLYFVQCLVTLSENLETRHETYRKLKTALNKRQQKVLLYIRDNEPAQVSDVELALGAYSRNTLKKDLAYLVRENLLLKTGERKGSRYHFLKRN